MNEGPDKKYIHKGVWLEKEYNVISETSTLKLRF